MIAAPAHRSVYRNRGCWLEHGVCEHCHGEISRLNPSRRHSGAHALGGYGWWHDETGAHACPPPAPVSNVEPEPDLENNGGGSLLCAAGISGPSTQRESAVSRRS